MNEEDGKDWRKSKTGKTLTIAGGGSYVQAVGGGRGVGRQVGSGVQQTPFTGVQLYDVTRPSPTRGSEQLWKGKRTVRKMGQQEETEDGEGVGFGRRTAKEWEEEEGRRRSGRRREDDDGVSGRRRKNDRVRRAAEKTMM